LLRPARRHLLHFAKNGSFFANRQIREVNALRAIDVTTRIKGQEIEHVLDTECRECLDSTLAYVSKLADGYVA
jgi:hypothetical protein